MVTLGLLEAFKNLFFKLGGGQSRVFPVIFFSTPGNEVTVVALWNKKKESCLVVSKVPVLGALCGQQTDSKMTENKKL